MKNWSLKRKIFVGIAALFAALTLVSIINYALAPTPSFANLSYQSDFETFEKEITISGDVEPKDAKVTINNEEIPVNNGHFEHTFPLNEGQNKIEIAARPQQANKPTKTSLVVTRNLTEEEKQAKEEAEAKAAAEAEAKREAEAKQKAEEEAKRKAEEESRRKADEEAGRKAREEEERKAKEREPEEIKALVAKQLEGKNNLDKEYIREIDVVEQFDGGWGVFVQFNASDSLTTGFTKKSIEMKMSEIYITLYTSGKDIKQVTVAAYFPLVDKYGNESDGVVYKTLLEKDEAEKVNWQTDGALLKLDVLPSVWTTLILHTEFR